MNTKKFSEKNQSLETGNINFEMTRLLDGMSLADKQSLANYIAKVRPERFETQISNLTVASNNATFSQDGGNDSKTINFVDYLNKTNKEHDNQPTEHQCLIIGFRTQEERKKDEELDYALKINGLGELALNWKKIIEQRRANVNNPNYPCVFWIRWMDLTALYVNVDRQEYVMDPIEALDNFGDNVLFLNELVNLISSPLNHMYSEEQKLIFKQKAKTRS